MSVTATATRPAFGGQPLSVSPIHQAVAPRMSPLLERTIELDPIAAHRWAELTVHQRRGIDQYYRACITPWGRHDRAHQLVKFLRSGEDVDTWARRGSILMRNVALSGATAGIVG